MGHRRRTHRHGGCAAWRHPLSRAIRVGAGFLTLRAGGASDSRGSRRRAGIDLAPMRRVVALGLPAASQVTLEVGVFAAATALAGRLAPTALAAHQIAVNLAALTFMVPLGVASAGAVRVGHAVGRHDPDGAARSGWTAILFGVSFMSCAAAAFLLIPRLLIGAFTSDPAVLTIGVSLLFVASDLPTLRWRARRLDRRAAWPRRYSHADVVEPRRSLVHRPAAGLRPVLRVGLGVIGLWWGLSTGLIICGVALLTAWSRRVTALRDSSG